ncbi:MAG: hypothetical protein UU16_C0049G0006 [Candidatus Woesebacteria bacterium GW2011_GWA2_40_7]|uniref:Uncharacterized protein n=1 Tax=Candidatus Woesebacteria bacterium GW2011_GWA2_40_7 TaxID=1618562 RepID=A0A0G0VJ13_9BACT|nr:MAG: hypothetical protein UU16_C0049G0006 [Candidatus Woesebacteria bacterium GW2011_GWA2_40_7]
MIYDLRFKIKTKINIKFIKIIIVLMVIVFATKVAKTVFAQEVLPLTVVPPKQEVLVNPGEKFTTTVKYLNQSSSPVNGTISVLDFIVEDKTPISPYRSRLTFRKTQPPEDVTQQFCSNQQSIRLEVVRKERP